MPSSRLTPSDRSRELLPLVRAEEYTRCFLYWFPSSFPVRVGQRQWQLEFYERLTNLLTGKFGLRAELFLDSKSLEPDLMHTFLTKAEEFVPIIGLGRRPGEKLPGIPSSQDIEDLQQGRKKFSFGNYSPSYCYWFLDKMSKVQRESFLGYGGLTTLFLAPDAQTQPMKLSFPKKFLEQPMFQRFNFDVDRMRQRTCSLLDKFLPESKRILGAGLESDPQFRGLLFILPLLETKHFFQQSEQEVAQWFQLFDVYINESIPDNGVIIAAKMDFESDLIEMLNQMRAEGFSYLAGEPDDRREAER